MTITTAAAPARTTAEIDADLKATRARIAALEARSGEIDSLLALDPSDADAQRLLGEAGQIPPQVRGAEIKIARLEAERVEAVKAGALDEFRAQNVYLHGLYQRAQALDDEIVSMTAALDAKRRERYDLGTDIETGVNTRGMLAQQVRELGMGSELDRIRRELPGISWYY